ncbi:MAG: SPOR domain-containing protein, partial [Rhizorhabdus sp.]
MTDYSRDRLGPDDEDRLPWLEPVEEEYEDGEAGNGRLMLWIGVGVLVIALVIGGFLWMRSSDRAASGDGALIEAPDSYYKERPTEEAPATGDDEIVYSASKGNEVESV